MTSQEFEFLRQLLQGVILGQAAMFRALPPEQRDAANLALLEAFPTVGEDQLETRDVLLAYMEAVAPDGGDAPLDPDLVERAASWTKPCIVRWRWCASTPDGRMPSPTTRERG